MKRAKTRRTWKPTESAHVCSSSSSRSRANTVLNEIRTSLPKRSTQPCSIVQSRYASVPSAWKSRSKFGSIHPKFIFFLRSNGIVRNRPGTMDGFAARAPVATIRCSHWPVAGTLTSGHCWKTARRAVATGHRGWPNKATVYDATNYCSRSRKHFQSWSWL